jgi:hypothetical protein
MVEDLQSLLEGTGAGTLTRRTEMSAQCDDLTETFAPGLLVRQSSEAQDQELRSTLRQLWKQVAET